MTDAEAVIFMHLEAGRTLTHSLVGERLWSLLEDPFTVFDDESPRRLIARNNIQPKRKGSLEEDRPDEYELTIWGRASLAGYRAGSPRH